jgi:rubrerythrin
MASKKGPERVDEMVESLKKWQSIERKSMEQTAEIMETTSNPVIRMVMEIIRQDSMMHHRVQQFMIDSLTREAVSLSPEEINEIWTKIEEHDEMEKDVINMAKELKEKAWSPVHKQLLDYLLTDEAKHDRLLEQLGELKKGMYPYGS